MSDEIDLPTMAKKALLDALRDRGHVNILIAGRTGVGKSSLINAVFQGNMAKTGQGRPVTQETREITKADIPVSIFDTRGLELKEFDAIMQALKGLVVRRAQETDARKHIHVGWVCIVEGPRRVESAEQNLTKMLAEHMPVVVVITQVFSDKSPEDGSSFRATVQSLLPMARNVMRVRAFPAELDGGHVIPSTGLSELIHLTEELVPEGQRRALAAAQKVDIALKKKQSRLIVAGAATAAATAGAIPIPFADAIVIVPIQVGMLAGITATFGLPLSEGLLTSVVASMVGCSGATVVGRALVDALLKFIPGVGTVAGCGIAAATAAALTTGLGETYIATLALLFTRHNGEPPSVDEVVTTFKQQYLQRTSR